MAGVLLSCVGADPISGVSRYTFGYTGFASGFAFTPALIGLFAISEVFVQLENIFEDKIKNVNISGIWPSRAEMRACTGTLVRGSIIGTIVGIIPGTGSGTASWISYNEARRASKTPEKFGTGYMPGVAATESANNAVCGGALVPMLALGIPGDVVTAVLMGGLMIQGLSPGPLLFAEKPGVVVGLFTGFFVANIFMFVFGMALIRSCTRILLIPKTVLTVSIVLFCFIGSYAINLNPVDLYTMPGFGVLGYLMQKFNFSEAALCIALILGPMAETNLRLGLKAVDDNVIAFCSSPITLLFLLLTPLSLAWPILQARMARKRVGTGDAQPLAE